MRHATTHDSRDHINHTTNQLNIDEKQAASEYGPSVHWFRRARWKGDGPSFIKLGGKVLYPRTELDRFFASRLVRSTSSQRVAA